MLYSLRGQFPTHLPFRIRLSSGLTKTDPSTFTLEEIAAAGYVIVRDKPTATSTQVVEWSNGLIDWVVRNKTQDEIRQEIDDQWYTVRTQRNALLQGCDWTQLPDSPLTELQKTSWANYRQQLRDVTTQLDPFNITWPTPPE